MVPYLGACAQGSRPGIVVYMANDLSNLRRELKNLSDRTRAKNLARFFKTGKGQYGYGDRFLGLTVPTLRRVATRYQNLPFSQIVRLLESRFHEERFTALEILVMRFEAGNKTERERVFSFYLRHANRINNWDLVDTSAPYIVGEHLTERSRQVLYRLARSKNLWERRIAMVSTFAFIRRGQLSDTFRLAEILLGDRHDLMHKAVGWALREAGKKSLPELERFLKKHQKTMPRTTLRYAIEHMPEVKRKAYLSGTA